MGSSCPLRISCFGPVIESSLFGHQHAKKVVSDILGLVDFVIGLVNSVFNLPEGQVMYFEEFE